MEEHTLGQKLVAYFVLSVPTSLFAYGLFAPLVRSML